MIRFYKLAIFLGLVSSLYGCQSGSSEPIMDKSVYSNFAGDQNIKTLPFDYLSSSFSPEIKNNPDQFAYLKQVEILRMGYLSDGLFITGFVVKPRAEGLYPIVIYNRGGFGPEDCLTPQTAIEVLARLAAEGYVVVASNYRGSCGSDGKDEFGGSDTNDVTNLISCLHEISRADTSRIGMMGLNRGGMMTFKAMRNNPRIKCAVITGGMANLQRTLEHNKQVQEVVKQVATNLKDNQQDVIDCRSVVQWAQEIPKKSPILIMHGTDDKVVPYDDAVEICGKFARANAQFKLIAFRKDDNTLTKHKDDAFEFTRNWFNAYLKEGMPFSEKSHSEVID